MTREEAIQRIKIWHLDDDDMKVLSVVIPELKESEDEKIRKFLVKHVSEWIGCIEHDLKISSKDVESEEELAMFKSGLAWLEKQKERVADSSKTSADEDEMIRQGLLFFIKKEREKKHLTWDKIPLDDYEAYLEKQKEQPAEVNAKAMLTSDRLASAEMTGRLKERNDIIDNPEKYGLQKPSEWSEEDEKMLIGIVERGNSEIPRGECGLTPNQVAWLETRLKSLRPQPHWKPSEEQMKALNEIINTLAVSSQPHKNDYLFNVLNGLRENLKKL